MSTVRDSQILFIACNENFCSAKIKLSSDKLDSLYLISVGTTIVNGGDNSCQINYRITLVKFRNAIKFQYYRNIRVSDDFSIFCHHQHSIFPVHMRKLR